MSKWQEQSFGHILPITDSARCEEKVAQDLVFVSIQIPDTKINLSRMERRFGFVDMLGIFGMFDICLIKCGNEKNKMSLIFRWRLWFVYRIQHPLAS